MAFGHPTLKPRRRFLKILGTALSCGYAGVLPAVERLKIHKRQGVLLGADTEIQLYHPVKSEAERLFALCFSEVSRLEKIFSLYDKNSAISELNREGRISEAPKELLELVETSIHLSKLTEGAFDITVQPLWEFYNKFFTQNPNSLDGPSLEQIEQVLARVGYNKLYISNKEITLGMEGMGITLNGIAQGYITDRVTQILAENGLSNLLVNMGEYRSLGKHQDGTSWRMGLADPERPWDYNRIVNLENAALATSGGYGSPFSKDMHHHHLLCPITGRSRNVFRSISVIAPTATQADALSTALYVVPAENQTRVRSRFQKAEVITQT